MSNNVGFDQIYGRLMTRYGPQGWWPARGRFEIVLGAVLTQGTAWNNAARAIAALKREKLQHPETLHALSPARLARTIRPAGFHNVKAGRLQAVAGWWLEHGGHRGIRGWPTDRLRESLLQVHGIGRETAGAIVLYAFERRVFVVDAYARRLFSRIGIVNGDESYEGLRRAVERGFTGGTQDYNEYHALIVAHGKTHCRARPVCSGCCLASTCAYASGRVTGR